MTETELLKEQLSSTQSMLQLMYDESIEREAKIIELNTEVHNNRNEIIDSINFSSELQQLLDPKIEIAKLPFSDFQYFIQQKDIVGGDLLWVRKEGNLTYIASIDCTGHGVAGAMLRMAAYFELNNVFDKSISLNPTELLHEFNNSFSNKISTELGTENATTFGMDIGLTCFDTKKQIIYFTGTNIRLVQVRANEVNYFTGNKGYIGDKELKNLTTIQIPFQPNDRYFMYSDGVSDQLGGDKFKKFSRKRLHQLIGNTSKVNLSTQIEIVKSALYDWKGKYEQTDDMLLVGVKI